MDEPAFDYSIRSQLPGQLESPVSIGSKFIRTLDALSHSSSSVFANWEVTDLPRKTSVPLAAARSRIGQMIEENAVHDDEGGSSSEYYGYNAMAFTKVNDMSRLIRVWINAGGKNNGHVWLQTGAPEFPVDLSIVTFPTFKAALLALVSNWQLPWISAHASRSNHALVPMHGDAGYLIESRPMLPQEPTFPQSPFEIPWIEYLSAALSAPVKLSPEIATERTPDGGLLMITTEERLDPDNPEHLRRARIIAETMIACTGYQPNGATGG